MQTPSSKCTRTGRSLLPAAPNHPLTNTQLLPLHLCASEDPNQATNFTPPLQVQLLAPCKGSQQGGISAHQCKWVGVVKISRSVQFSWHPIQSISGELWFVSKLPKLYCIWCHWKGFLVTYLLLRPPTALQGGPKEYKRTMVAEAETLSERKNCKFFHL